MCSADHYFDKTRTLSFPLLIPKSRNASVWSFPRCTLSFSFLCPESSPFVLSSQSISVSLPTERPWGCLLSIVWVWILVVPQSIHITKVFLCLSLIAFLPLVSLSLSSSLKIHISIIFSCQQLRATTTTSGRCFVPFTFKPQHAYFSLQSLSKRSCSALADRPCDVSCCHW